MNFQHRIKVLYYQHPYLSLLRVIPAHQIDHLAYKKYNLSRHDKKEIKIYFIDEFPTEHAARYDELSLYPKRTITFLREDILLKTFSYPIKKEMKVFEYKKRLVGHGIARFRLNCVEILFNIETNENDSKIINKIIEEELKKYSHRRHILPIFISEFIGNTEKIGTVLISSEKAIL